VKTRDFTELIQDATLAGSIGLGVGSVNLSRVIPAAFVAHDATPLPGYILNGAIRRLDKTGIPAYIPPNFS